MDVYCQAFTHKGKLCGGVASSNGLCKLHLNSRNHHGPNTFALKQLENVHKSRLDSLKSLLGVIDMDTYEADRKIAIGEFEKDKQALIKIQKQSVTWTGVDPDAEANEKKRIHREKLQVRREELRRIWLEARRREMMNHGGYGGYVGGYEWHGVAEQPAGPRELRDIATDPQSVHTSEVVKQTTDLIDRIRDIPVPDEYRWAADVCSKTPGEIIAECKLSQKAALQMMTQYSLDTAIYDIEEGIYGKVLDSVWQFVKKSDDRADLCAILKQEMEDNIGMCAQGNLTRICNILSGYMDGVESVESMAERLGRLLSPLLEMEDASKRISEGTRIMREYNVPREHWSLWLEPLE